MEVKEPSRFVDKPRIKSHGSAEAGSSIAQTQTIDDPQAIGQPDYTPTPDRRYFVVRGRLWRLSNPFLGEQMHTELVQELMSARRAVRNGKTSEDRITARLKVDSVKRKLGERGPVWWNDGAPDYNRRLAKNTPYATWFFYPNSPRSEDQSRGMSS